jgi:hypothetical protein
MGISATSGPVATPLSTRVCTLYTHLHAHIVRHRTVWEQSRVVSFCGRCRSVSIGSDKAALCGLYLRSHCSGCLQIWHKGAHAICARAITFSEHHIGWEQSWQPPNTCACTHTPPHACSHLRSQPTPRLYLLQPSMYHMCTSLCQVSEREHVWFGGAQPLPLSDLPPTPL